MMAAASTDVTLSNSVLATIVDHWKRVKTEGTTAKFLGAIFGQHTDRELKIVTASASSSDAIVHDYFSYKELYKDMSFLGWYSTGNVVIAPEILRELLSKNESPIVLELISLSINSDLSKPVAVLIRYFEGETIKKLSVKFSCVLAAHEEGILGDNMAGCSTASDMSVHQMETALLNCKLQMVKIRDNSGFDDDEVQNQVEVHTSEKQNVEKQLKDLETKLKALNSHQAALERIRKLEDLIKNEVQMEQQKVQMEQENAKRQSAFKHILEHFPMPPAKKN